MRSTLLTFVLGSLSCFALACGSTTSGVPGDGGTPFPDGGGGGGDGSVLADGGCGTPPPGATCPTTCNGQTGGFVCVNGAWVCPPVTEQPCFFDAAVDSAAADSGHGDSGVLADGGLACGAASCNPATQYCQNDNGIHNGDGAVTSSYTCTPLPAACDAGASCACIASGGCACVDDAGAITVTCNFP